jgi:hypothetical protein
MNETIEPYVKKLLDGGMKTAEEVAKFIELQAPELGNEIVRWGALSECAAPLIFFILMLICMVLHFNYGVEQWYTKGTLDERYGNPPGWPINLVVFIAGFMGFAIQILDVLGPLVAPRLYILETISNFVK